MKYILLLAITTLLLSCGGAEERKITYLDKAQLSLKSGDLEKARIELSNVLQIDPNEAQAYFLLGQVYEKQRAYSKAFGNFKKASELDEDNLEYHSIVGTYYIFMAEKLIKAIEKRDFILNIDDTNIHGLMLKAAILARQNEDEKAIAVSKEIHSKHPDNVKNVTLLTTLYVKNSDYDKAAEVLNDCLSFNQDAHELRKVLASTYFKAKKYDLAEEQFKTVIDKQPESFENYSNLATLYNEIGEIDKAEMVLRNAVVDDDMERIVAHINYIRSSKGDQTAIETLKEYINNKPYLGDLRIELGRIYYTDNKLKEAEDVFKQAVVDFSDNSVGVKSRVILANIYIKLNEFDKANSVTNAAITISPNDVDVLFVKAKLLMRDKDYEQAIIALRSVIKDDTSNIDSYVMLSESYRATNSFDQANETINAAYDNNKTNKKALIQLAKYYSRRNDNAGLDKVIDASLVIDADNYEMLALKAQSLNKAELYSEAASYAARLIKLYPDKSAGYMQSMPGVLVDKGVDEAIVYLEDGLTKVVDDTKILGSLASLYSSKKEYNAAIKKINASIKEHGEKAEKYMILAKIEMISGDYEDALISANKVIELKPDWNEPYILLANYYKSQTEIQKAIDIVQQGIAALDGDLKLTLVITQLYESISDYEAVIREYEKAYAKYTDNAVLMNNLAVMLVEHRTDIESYNQAKVLADKLINVKTASVQDTVGWVYYKTEHYALAMEVLKYVVGLYPDIPAFNYHYGMALYGSGDKPSAKIYLQKAVNQENNFTGREEAEAVLARIP